MQFPHSIQSHSLRSQSAAKFPEACSSAADESRYHLPSTNDGISVAQVGELGRETEGELASGSSEAYVFCCIIERRPKSERDLFLA